MSGRRGPEWLPVFRWELKRVLRRGDFIVSVLLTPLLALAFGALPRLMEGRKETATIAAVQPGAQGGLVPAVLPAAERVRWTGMPEDPRVRNDAPPGGTFAFAALERAVRERIVAGAVVLAADFDTSGRATLIVRSGRPAWVSPVREALEEHAREQRARALGLAPAQLSSLLAPVQVEERTASASGASRDQKTARAERIVGLAILTLMMTVLLSTISYFMIGISGEKLARVTEVVVSAIRAEAWMDGKILAFTVVGLIMAAVWALSLLLLGGAFAFALPGSVRAGNVLLYAAYAVLGLYFYNALFAAVLATMQGIESSAKFQGYFFMLPFLPFAFMVPALRNPDAPWLVALSQVPTFSQTLIPVRMALEAVQPWEIALGLAVLAAGSWWMRGVAGRIFRLGMLMYGKDPTLPEILRWARER